jgi:hypothetical protein
MAKSIFEENPMASRSPPIHRAASDGYTTATVAALPPGERTRIEAEVKAVIAEEPTPSGREMVTVPY